MFLKSTFNFNFTKIFANIAQIENIFTNPRDILLKSTEYLEYIMVELATLNRLETVNIIKEIYNSLDESPDIFPNLDIDFYEDLCDECDNSKVFGYLPKVINLEIMRIIEMNSAIYNVNFDKNIFDGCYILDNEYYVLDNTKTSPDLKELIKMLSRLHITQNDLFYLSNYGDLLEQFISEISSCLTNKIEIYSETLEFIIETPDDATKSTKNKIGWNGDRLELIGIFDILEEADLLKPGSLERAGSIALRHFLIKNEIVDNFAFNKLKSEEYYVDNTKTRNKLKIKLNDALDELKFKVYVEDKKSK